MVLHAIIALVILAAPFVAKYLLLISILYFLLLILKTNNVNEDALKGAAYITGIEVLTRMTGGSFTYEFAKYAVAGFLLIGILYKGFKKSAWPYLLFLVILIPGIFVSSVTLNYGTKVGNAIGFNLSGPFCLAISALYCYDLKITRKQFQQVLDMVLLPIISMTLYLYLFTPDLRDSLSGTASNFATSGGFGPNQVATILGLGIFILFTRLLTVKNRIINILDLILIGLMTYRGVATFSRGGIFAALGCILLFAFFYLRGMPRHQKSKLLPRVAIIIFTLIISYSVVSIFSDGLIDKRYTNQNAAGDLKKDITTGRQEIISMELKAFADNFILGIGVGKVKEYRYNQTGEIAATHNEVSRMLSEHGLFGVLGLLILIITPLNLRYKNKSNFYLFSFLFFWFLTINHSSMRIAAPGFIYGLSLITFVKIKSPVYLKYKSV